MDPILAAAQSWRVEFQIHRFISARTGDQSETIFYLNGTGVIARIYPGTNLELESVDPVTLMSPCYFNILGRTNVLVRMQKNASAMTLSCEIWNYDGTGYSQQVLTLSRLVPRTYTGGIVGGGAYTCLGFLRVATGLLPMGSRPPTTADAGDWTELKFDGSLIDSSGHGHNASGLASYTGTPNQIAIANPKTLSAPSWSNWTSLRAGYPATLDGSASYSLADASSAVSYSWQETNGPSTVAWTNQNSATPTLNGLVFGTYDFTLQVTDAAGSTGTSTLEVGAVATDNNGVVVNADPNVDRIFGPMIAWGKNPWGYADERAMTATMLRAAAYNAEAINPPSFATPGNGTVSYIFNGVGYAGAPGTSLAAVVGAGDGSIAVADASRLNLSELPTRILLGSSYSREEVRVCSASALSGPATLGVCYDGRGQSNPGDSYRTPAQAWQKGTTVSQMKVTGSGTSFLSALCPAGPGPNGNSVYSSGSIQLTPGSAAAVGVGVNWTAGAGASAGNLIRVAATHGGVPFVFVAYIASLTDPTHMVLVRPFPADADAGSFTYSIIKADFLEITLYYTRTTDGSNAQLYFSTSGCESDTAVYLYAGHDIPSLDGTVQTSKQYSVMDGYSTASMFGPNFYGEDLAHRALYYRSGWNPALQTARIISDHYVNSPAVAGGDAGGIPLVIGGGVIGGFASAILDTSDPNRPAWTDLRGLARNGSIGATGCNAWDSRDSGYQGAWLTLAANFDPDPTEQTNWQTQLKQLLARDQACKGADNSWSTGFLWSASGVPLTVTTGSPVVTGSGIPSSTCSGIASGTMSVVNGSGTGYGSGFVAGNQIAISGTLNGAPYTGFYRFSINSNGSVTLGALWPGDSGTATWIIENSDNLTTIATGSTDPQLKKNWACVWNSPSQITLSRPWDGPSASNEYLFSYALAGFGQQPFMLGVRIFQMDLASHNQDSSIASPYSTLAAQAATWVHDVGYDPATQGLHYGRVFGACEPDTTPPPGSSFTARTPGCNLGLDPDSTQAARVLTAEGSQALRVYYQSNPTPAAQAWGDIAYGSIWGYAPYTTGGVYTDSNYVRAENSDSSLDAYKWTGFFFGMGMAHQWPAVRLGGVAQAQYRKVPIDVAMGIAAKTQISVTAPSGKIDIYTCESSPCEITVDDRQGSHWYRVQYLSSDGNVVSECDPVLLPLHDGRTLPAARPTETSRLAPAAGPA